MKRVNALSRAIGSSRRSTRLNVSWLGMPCLSSRMVRRRASFSPPNSAISTQDSAPQSMAASAMNSMSRKSCRALMSRGSGTDSKMTEKSPIGVSSKACGLSPGSASELLEQRVRARGLGLAGRFLDVELLHHAILDQHGIAFRAQPEAIAGTVECHVDRLGKFPVAVSQELDLAFGIARLLPRIHHEAVVDGGDRDGVDALGLDRGGVLHEAGQMVLVAGRREGAGDGEQHDLLALEDLVGGLPARTLGRHHSELRF